MAERARRSASITTAMHDFENPETASLIPIRTQLMGVLRHGSESNRYVVILVQLLRIRRRI